MSQKILKIGVDLDGVIAQHSLGGFWVVLRKLKERILKTTRSANWYYPNTFLEKLAWRIINWLRVPFTDKDGLFASLAGENKARFYLVTSRFKFLEKLTGSWLKKYHLDKYFAGVLINTKDIDPLVFKAKVINDKDMDFFIEDDLDVIDYLEKNTSAKLCWVVPGHTDFIDTLKRLFPKKKRETD